MAFYDYRIAAGFNNAVGLVNVEKIAIAGERGFIMQNYGHFNPGAFKVRGDGTLFLSGFGSTSWIFEAITKNQFRYLQETYCNNGYSGKVTIRTRTDDPDVYANYNAIMILPKLPDLRKVTSGFADNRVTFTRLVAI